MFHPCIENAGANIKCVILGWIIKVSLTQVPALGEKGKRKMNKEAEI